MHSISLLEMAEIESGLQFKMPKAFKEHYARYNGGVPESPNFDPEDDDLESLEVSEFLPLKYPTDDDRTLEKTYASLVARDVLPDDLLPFALDWGGNFFCLDRDGQVYFYTTDSWRPNLSNDENKKRSRKLICGSFSDFLAGLY
ncbi:SMI1/KNR4 family protein [Azospirillum sp. B4]|uniref:SMI1/KNR4 family protein n=1 Tax=Azospirillum sp. B4 TaxID=95605 RepID=UPI00034B29EA|nr:SMI1/KNR4 family protein [Azospirillum sp. B4]